MCQLQMDFATPAHPPHCKAAGCK